MTAAAAESSQGGRLLSIIAHLCLKEQQRHALPLVLATGPEADALKDTLLHGSKCVYSGARTFRRVTAILALEHHFTRVSLVHCEGGAPPWLSSAPGRMAAMLPTTKLALARFHALNPSISPKKASSPLSPLSPLSSLSSLSLPSTEARIFFILTPALDFYVHVASLPHQPSEAVVAINTAAGPRDNPTVKSTDWVIQRACFEQASGPGVNDTVLCHDGLLYEGLQSNFWVVTDRSALVTAGSDVTLLGTIQKILLDEVIPALDPPVPVSRECPRLDDIASWKGAFLTSTSRLVLPISKVRVIDGDKPVQLLDIPSSPIVTALQAGVLQRMDDDATTILDSGDLDLAVM